MSVCKHYKNITVEKLGNLLKTSKLTECQNQKHNASNVEKSSDLWFCLTCGFAGCSRQSPLQCSLNHYEQAKHNLCINLTSLSIWCYQCDNSIDEILEEIENKNAGEAKKLGDFKEKISQLFYKFTKELKKNKNIVIKAGNNENFDAAPEIGKPDESQISKAIFGLQNIGNTCFFNSVMQCLNATNALTNVYSDLKNFDVSDLKDVNENASFGANDDWVTVTKPKAAKGKAAGKGGAKGKNNQAAPVKYSSFINICKNYQDFLVEARGSKNHLYNPSNLFNSISHLFSRFRGYSQQDAQELLRNFLDGLSTCEENRFTKEELAKSRKNYKHRLTEVEKVFGGYLCNFVKCQDCSYVNRTFDFCLDIVLNIDREKPRMVEPASKKKKKKGQGNKTEEEPVENTEEAEKEEHKEEPEISNQERYTQVDYEQIKNTVIPGFDHNLYDLYEPNIDVHLRSRQNQKGEGDSETITLDDALKEFMAVEVLSKSKNFYRCETCEKDNRVSSGTLRRYFIHDPPPVLTLVLKRYRQLGIGRFEKVNTQVKFDETLILDPYVLLPVKKSESDTFQKSQKPQFEYSLYGVVVQSGHLNGGHYISYTKHIINNEEVWFYHSDTTFKAVKKESALKSQPYILFYELKSKK